MLTSCFLAIAITTSHSACSSVQAFPNNPLVAEEAYTPPDRKAPDNRKGGASR